MHSPVFIDVEASGITGGGFPIEVGWSYAEVMADGVALHAHSLLVRPTDAWRSDPSRWHGGATAAHGLTLDDLLRDGRDVTAVCDRLDAALSGWDIASDTGAGDWDDDWLMMLYDAAGRRRHWDLSPNRSGAHVAARFRAIGLDPRVVRPALRPWLPPHTHAAAEDALAFAWEWGMAGLLAAALPPGLDEQALAALLADLPRLIPRQAWPAVTAGSEAGLRRR